MRHTDHAEAGRLTPAHKQGHHPAGASALLRALRHRCEFAAILIAREMFRHLPPDVAVALGARLGASYARLSGPRTSVAATNLAIAFPEARQSERRRLLIDSFANIGRCIAEVFLLQGRYRDELLSGLSVEGLEHYEEAKKVSASGGVIVLTAHFGSWELCGAAMARSGYPLSVVRHDVGNPYLERMVSAWRSSSAVEEIQLGHAALGVFRALAQGRLVAMLLDQNAHRDEGVFAPFFSLLASTRSAPANLAMNRSLPVLPVFVYRIGATAKHVVRVFPRLTLEPTREGDDGAALERNVALMNQAIEDVIREAPDHWLWSHRRWKTRPDGEPRVYPRRKHKHKQEERSRTGFASSA